MSPLEKWLAPGILLTIGLIQLTLAFSRDLSPWKGGGFGMFSSVDSPSMRELACNAITVDGEPIRIDALLLWDEDLADSQQAMPNPRLLSPLAGQLLHSDFVPLNLRDQAAEAKMRFDNPDLPLDFIPPDFEETSRYRPLRSSDPISDENQIVRIQSVSLRWWRVRYDHGDKLIRTEPITEEVRLNLPPALLQSRDHEQRRTVITALCRSPEATCA